MYKPYIKPVAQVSPDFKHPEPHYSRFVLLVLRIFARLYLFLFLGVARVVLRGGVHLFGSFKRALAGESRCIVAFRHPNGGEAQILGWFMLFKLRKMARKGGVRFSRSPRMAFVYGYEVFRWGGSIVRWVMPQIGAMPVHHTKMDTRGMARITRALTEGPYPLAIAPEGQVSYVTESVLRLEQGPVRIGFQVAEKLEKQGRSCPVEVLPVSIHFRYGRLGKLSLERVLKKIEKYTGMPQDPKTDFTERVRRARDYILNLNEKRYGIQTGENSSFAERIEVLMEAALVRAENILGIGRAGSELFERLYRIRQICWDRIYLPGNPDLTPMTRIERAAADLREGEAWHAGRHIELVDFIWYFRIPLPSEDDLLHNKIEYAQNLWDFANRTMGGAYSNRVINVHPKRVIIQAAPPINLSSRLPAYREDKKGTVNQTMSDLKDAYLDCINEAAKYQIRGKFRMGDP
jgi:1-acyl-sn-glycerol-3-phosphate acyltransferase